MNKFNCITEKELEKLKKIAGGTALFIPLRKPLPPVLELTLSEESKRSLRALYGGTTFYVPLDSTDREAARAARDAEIVSRRQKGEPPATVARALGVSVRHVQRVWRAWTRKEQ